MNKRIIEEIRKIEKSLAVISSILEEEGKAEEIRFEVSKKPSVIKVTEQEVTKLMHQLGIPANIKGYNYIRTAVMMVIEEPDILHAITKELYPELAKTYKNVSEKIEKGELPEENTVLTIGMYGEKEDFYTLKGVVENVLEVAEVKKYDLFKDEENKLYHPGRCASLKVGNDIFASLGELHPLVAENYNLNDRVLIAEINIDKIVKYARFNKKYVEIPKYPAVERDIAMVVDEAVEVGQIERIITKKAKKMLEEINLFDVYRNEKLGENKKSVAYSLKFRLSDRTLTDEEVNTTMQEIIAALEKELNAELRK